MTETTVEIAEIQDFGFKVASRHNNQAFFTNATEANCARQARETAELIQPRLTTEELAALLHVKPQTVRAGLCKSGHYLGMRPAVKLPNRRLLWDAKLAAHVLGA